MKREIIKENIGVPMAFAYKLLMSKEYCGGTAESEELLTDYNKFIKDTSLDLYWNAAKITNKGYLMCLFGDSLISISLSYADMVTSWRREGTIKQLVLNVPILILLTR